MALPIIRSVPTGPACGRPENKLRQAPMWPAVLRRQGWVKISPVRVFAFNQIDFPVALPLLDLPFPDQRCLKAFMGFEPHETVHAVFGGKAGDGACFVLPNAAREFVGRTDVESPIGFSGEEIDERHRADRNMGPCRSLSSGRP